MSSKCNKEVKPLFTNFIMSKIRWTLKQLLQIVSEFNICMYCTLAMQNSVGQKKKLEIRNLKYEFTIASEYKITKDKSDSIPDLYPKTY